MTYPLVAELADAGIPVTVSCRVLKLARQPYYRWRNDPVRDADVLRAYRMNALHDAHHDDPTFGYRYLADEARRAGWRMSRRTAWKLCSQAGILSSAQRRRRGKGKKAGPPVFDDHVQRQFRADAPNRVWLTDITEHRTSEGKLYCCAIKDVFSNRIVGYSMSDRMTAKLAAHALRSAVARRGDVAGCILHADRGSQFRSRAMARELRRHDMVGHCCGDASGQRVVKRLKDICGLFAAELIEAGKVEEVSRDGDAQDAGDNEPASRPGVVSVGRACGTPGLQYLDRNGASIPW